MSRRTLSIDEGRAQGAGIVLSSVLSPCALKAAFGQGLLEVLVVEDAEARAGFEEQDLDEVDAVRASSRPRWRRRARRRASMRNPGRQRRSTAGSKGAPRGAGRGSRARSSPRRSRAGPADTTRSASPRARCRRGARGSGTRAGAGRAQPLPPRARLGVVEAKTPGRRDPASGGGRRARAGLHARPPRGTGQLAIAFSASSFSAVAFASASSVITVCTAERENRARTPSAIWSVTTSSWTETTDA